MNLHQTILAAVNVIGFVLITILAMLSIKFGNEWANAMMQNILPLLIGCWITNVTTVINYVFGSNASSQKKNETIARIAERSEISRIQATCEDARKNEPLATRQGDDRSPY